MAAAAFSVAAAPCRLAAGAAVRRRPLARLAKRASSSSSSSSLSPTVSSPDEAPPSFSGSGSGSVLFLSPTLWPEPSSSAAGVRTSALLRRFAAATPSPNDGTRTRSPLFFDSVHYGCGAARPSRTSPGYAHLVQELETKLGIRTHAFPLNRTTEIEASLNSTALRDLKCVLFDRYFAEEAYSFHVRRWRPDVVRVLDMQDFHALRAGRREAVRRWDSSSNGAVRDGSGDDDGEIEMEMEMMTDRFMEKLVRYVPSHLDLPGTGTGAAAAADDLTERRGEAKVRDLLLRELAAIHRSDLTLVCSPRERRLLVHTFGVDPSKLCLAPFFASEHPPAYDGTAEEQFEKRKDFVVLGGFRHPPNVDSVVWLKREIWPRIRSRLPDVNVHVWGAYPPNRILQLHDPRNGFLVRGHLDDLEGELSQRRALLAPLRYGAGIKGKIVDGFRCGLPVVTTPIGAEGTVSGGMSADPDALAALTVRRPADRSGIDDLGWGGLVASTPDALASCAAALYTDRSLWSACRDNGRRLLRSLFDRERNLRAVEDAIRDATDDLEERRAEDVTGSVLWHQRNRSSEYFSRWIELKETERGEREREQKDEEERRQ